MTERLNSTELIRSHAFESVLMRWDSMKPITQSERTKKEKDKAVY